MVHYPADLLCNYYTGVCNTQFIELGDEKGHDNSNH